MTLAAAFVAVAYVQTVGQLLISVLTLVNHMKSVS